MPPKTKQTPIQVERDFIRRCEDEGKRYTKFEKSPLAKYKGNGSNQDLTKGVSNG